MTNAWKQNERYNCYFKMLLLQINLCVFVFYFVFSKKSLIKYQTGGSAASIALKITTLLACYQCDQIGIFLKRPWQQFILQKLPKYYATFDSVLKNVTL